MSDPKIKLLYVYEERVPENLRQCVIDHIPEDEFVIDRMTYLTSEADQCEKMRWADVVLFAPGRHLPETVLEAAKDVKLMQLWSSGFDKFNAAGAASFGIPVANNGGSNAISVSEHTILLMLAVYKWLPDSHARTVEGRWTGNSHGMDMFLMHKKTLGIVGFGNIGRNVAQRARGFGMKILYYDIKRAGPEIEAELGAEYCPFEDLIQQADILTLHLHLNKETEALIGRREIDMMKDSAILINVSRAQLVDYNELRLALEEGRLHGAGLDVYNAEPTQPDDPLLTHPHVVATPHMAGSTYDTYGMALGNCVENFRRVCRGEKAKWVVNGV